MAGLGGLTGCSGGGGAAGGAARLATQTRLLKPGDKWVYSVTGTSIGINPPVTGTGTVTITISSQPFNGGVALARETVDHFVTTDNNSIDFDTTTYFTQDAASRDIKEIGESSSDSLPQAVVTPQTIEFGSWTNNETLSPSLDFGGGDVEPLASQTVVGTETVQTPIGSFAAWKVTTPSPLPALPRPFVWDWAPQLGAPVRFETLYLYSTNQATVNVPATAVITSTTVPH
jgi:hypothetical protein